MSDRPERGRLPGWSLPVAVALLVAGQQLALLAVLARRYVSEDQALLWAAARDMGRGQLRQPNFWGQAYGVTFEAAPAELLRHFGVGYPTGLPLGVIVLNLVVWWLPAGAAWLRGRRWLAIAALAAPVVLSLEHGLMMVVYNTAFGRMLAGSAAALALWRPDLRRVLAAVLALGGLAVLFDASSALIVGPVMVMLLGHRRSWGRYRDVGLSALIGLAPVIVWLMFTRWWYDRHPDDSLHPSPALAPSWEVLSDNLSHPTRHFSTFAPELWRSPAVAAMGVLALVVLAVRRRDPLGGLAVASFVGLTLFALSLPRSRDGLPTIYYAEARVLLSFPLGLWCCAATLRPARSAGAGSVAVPHPWRRPLAAALFVGVIAASAGVRAVTWDGRVGAIRDDAVAFENYPLSPTSTLVGLCDRVERAAEARQIEVVLFDLRTPAYACAGVFGAAPITLYPPYERRAWWLRRADTSGAAELLVVGPTPGSCEAAGLACRDIGDEMIVVELAGNSPLGAARLLGVTVRPFDPADRP